ncbi:hypothetical protein OF83DRAFT_1146144 [Amylostereum chailletii]|nr:hypothetical protein OF83DRAFT_1146144 [Amylostereum chailletii]
MSASPLLSLPSELIAEILSSLPFQDVFRCKRTCRALDDIVRGSAQIQYRMHLGIDGLEDDHNPGLSYADRLELLQRRETAWSNMEPQSVVKIPSIPFESSGIYDFTGGACVLGTRLSQGVRPTTSGYAYVDLPSLGEEDKPMKWRANDVGEEVVDIGLCIYEHDLSAVLTSKPEGDGPADDISYRIHLLSFSTGRPHPSASQPVVFVTSQSRSLGHVNVAIEIVGDYLALMITYPWARGFGVDTFYLLNWRKGDAHRIRVTPSNTYGFFVFLTDRIMVFPDMDEETLELMEIVDGVDGGPPTLRVLRKLALPTFAPETTIIRLSARGEPNPIGSCPRKANPASASRPFRDSPSEALILFHLLTQVDNPTQLEMHTFTFVTHRSTLVAQVPIAPMIEEPSTVPWEEWGPHGTRWFESDEAATRWITMAAGQRYVYLSNVEGGHSPIRVCDFNPYHVRRELARVEDQTVRTPEDNTRRVIAGETKVIASNVFQNDVVSSLPYCETTTEAVYKHDGVLLDEERVIGLNVRVCS